MTFFLHLCRAFSWCLVVFLVGAGVMDILGSVPYSATTPPVFTRVVMQLPPLFFATLLVLPYEKIKWRAARIGLLGAFGVGVAVVACSCVTAIQEAMAKESAQLALAPLGLIMIIGGTLFSAITRAAPNRAVMPGAELSPTAQEPRGP